jgi:pyruvate carboxylase
VVGDLALYLVLKGLKTSDLVDPITNQPMPDAMLLDFPESVVGLLKGDLGKCHCLNTSRELDVKY